MDIKYLPKVSVIMAAFDSEKYVVQAVQSILKQSFKDFELIIVDDASTDDTYTLLERFAKCDARVKLSRNKKNLGYVESRKIALSRARAELIAHMDSDDVSYSRRIEVQYRFLNENLGISICFGDIDIIDSYGRFMYNREYPKTDVGVKAKFFRWNPVPDPAVMLRKEILSVSGYYNRRYEPVSDLDLWLRLGKNFKFGHVGRTILKHRIHDVGVSRMNVRKTEELSFRLRAKALGLGYVPSFGDLLFNLGHMFVFFLLPSKLKQFLFEYLRKRKYI